MKTPKTIKVFIGGQRMKDIYPHVWVKVARNKAEIRKQTEEGIIIIFLTVSICYFVWQLIRVNF